MASGIDTAGLVLGLFPVVIGTADWYRGRITGRDVKHLADSLKATERIFLNSIEKLLRCIVPAAEVKELLEDSSASRWEDQSLRQRVEDHLGNEAEGILDKIAEIHKIISKMKDKLPTRNSDNDDSKFRYHTKLIVKSFVNGSQYKLSLDRLKGSVNEFRDLTQDAIKLAPSRGVLPRALRDLTFVQECAGRLYDAVQDSWKCDCTELHPANIKLDMWCAREQEKDDVRLMFVLLFAHDTLMAQPDHWMNVEITPQNKANVADLVNNLCGIVKEIEHQPEPTDQPSPTRRRHGSICEDANGFRYELVSDPAPAVSTRRRSSFGLADCFTQQHTLTNKSRVQIAHTLAWAVLQISSTNWLNGTWTRDNIMLVVEADKRPLPYVSHRFKASGRKNSLTRTLSPDASHHVEDWVPSRSLFALGVFLLEVCYLRSIEDLAEPYEKGPDGRPVPHTPLLTVMRLSHAVQDELGAHYAHAVKSCLNLPDVDLDHNGEPTDHLQFAKSMMRHIVEPLKITAAPFDKLPAYSLPIV